MSRANGRAVDAVFRACNDRRYRAEHFIVTDISAEFLRDKDIDMTVAAFKDVVRASKPAFITHTGNMRKAPLMRVNVYSIIDIKKSIEGGDGVGKKTV